MDGHELVHRGVRYRYLALPVGSDNELKRLTAGEQDVVARVLHGASNEEIARARGTRVRTVANQLTLIYRKLEVRSRNELCTVVAKHGAGGT